MFLSILRQWLGIELIEVSVTEKLVAALGGGLSILLLMLFTCWVIPDAGSAAIIASMGASAVLLYAVPHGQLSQPWPVLAGHVVSAMIGVMCARWLSPSVIAAASAVGLSIGAMHWLKCIHPPGGATALTAVIGGDAIHRMGFGFVVCPVLCNAVLMVTLAVLINGAFRWRRYPAMWSLAPASVAAGAPSHEEVLAAMRLIDSFVDISEADLIRLVELLHARSDENKP